MKVILVNGSPRKNFNTMAMLMKAKEGAEAKGAKTEVFHLYDYTYKGCISCFACKVKNSKTNGVCAYRDDLRPLLEKLQNADVLIIGAPIYYDQPNAQTRSFLERLMFPLSPYMVDPKTKERLRFLDRTLPVGLIYTMNCPEELSKQFNYPILLGSLHNYAQQIFGYAEMLCAYNTYQYADYSRYDTNMFDEHEKAEYREQQFPIDCKKAYELAQHLMEYAGH